MKKTNVLIILYSFIIVFIIFNQNVSSYYELEYNSISTLNDDGLVIILIDQGIMQYDSLITKIDRYANDVRQSLQTSIEQIQINTSLTDKQIRTILQNKYLNDNLVGCVLIGNITTPYYDIYPTVFPYQDLDETYGADIWIGVIRSPIKGYESIDILEKYFDRNHAFHSKELVYNRAGIYASTYEPEEILKERVERSGRWNPIGILGNHSDTKYWKTQYLKLLTTNAEILHVHGHGGQLHHDQDIWYTDIMDNPPQAALIYLQTCNTGNFNITDYLGGWYLFSGNTLAVITHTSPVWGFKGSGWGEGDNMVHLLSIAGGSILGTAVISSHPIQETIVILGDPTLALPEVSPQTNQLFTPDIGKIVIGRKNTSIEKSWYTDHILSTDLNNDNAIDVIIDNNLYINNGRNAHQMFTKKPLNISGVRPCSVDIDNDNDMDIITAGDSINIYLNSGDGNIKLYDTIGNQSTKAVAAADFDNDGDIDIIASNETGSIFFYEKNEDKYTSIVIETVSWQPYALVTENLDMDDDMDLIIGDRAGFLHFLINKGNGTFTKISKQFGGYFYHGVSTGDIDNDGDSDILLNGVFCNHKILINNGEGEFSEHNSLFAYEDAFLCLGVAIDDFDSDGDADILTTQYDGIHFKENTYGYENNPPENLAFIGPTNGKKQREYEYSLSAKEPDNDKLYYYVSWGDGSSDWIGPCESSQETILFHTWDTKGEYLITAKAYDTNFYESNTATIKMNTGKTIGFIDLFFQWFHQKNNNSFFNTKIKDFFQ